jgi:hypothetical protein
MDKDKNKDKADDQLSHHTILFKVVSLLYIIAA